LFIIRPFDNAENAAIFCDFHERKLSKPLLASVIALLAIKRNRLSPGWRRAKLFDVAHALQEIERRVRHGSSDLYPPDRPKQCDRRSAKQEALGHPYSNIKEADKTRPHGEEANQRKQECLRNKKRLVQK